MIMSLTAMAVVALALGPAGWVRAQNVSPWPDPGQTWVEINGETYGARPDERGPIGGGPGYTGLLTSGTYRVSNVDALREALSKAQPGEVVFVTPDAEIDCTTLVYAEKLVIEVPAGVTLAGDRGHEGSPGALICSDAFQTSPLIRAMGPDVRITGLRIRGPDPKRRLDHHARSFRADRGDSKAQHEYYYRFPVSTGIQSAFPNLQVDNCELSGFSHAAVYLTEGTGHHIHHNYIHHNQYHGLGYGVCHGYGEQVVSLIECNLFNYNRHSIAATGTPGNGYEARNNVELGVSLSHNFDMHGGRDRGDGTDIAGDWMKVHHNTFRGPDVAAVVVRGVPQQQVEIHHNWFYHPAPGGNVVSPWPPGAQTRLECSNNSYGAQQPTVQ